MTVAEVRPEKEVRLEKVVSHEDAKFDIARSRLTVGCDGRLYFAAGESLLRMERDGSQRAGARVPAAMTRGTANAKGIIGTGHAHFTHAVKTWRPDFSEIGAVSEFLNNDQVQYFAPTDVQAGSTDFYGYDTNRNRIVRVSPEAKLLTTYPLEAAGLNTITKLARFRVWETGQQFYVRFENAVTCVGFDGKKRWQVELGAAGNPWDGWRDVFDVDDTGQLLVLAREADLIKIIDAEGRPAGEVRLKRPASDEKPNERRPRVEDLAVWQDELFVKLDDPVELCAVYDRATGDFKRSLLANVEIVRATLPSAVWTAGERVPVTINRESSAGISDGKSQISDSKTEILDPQSKTEIPDPQSKIKNQKSKIENRLWLRPFNTPEFSELPFADGQVVVPADLSGLFHLRISPDLREAGSADQLDTVVEIRVPNAKGSVSIFTPLNRLYYGQGELISVSVVTRTPFPDELPRQWRVRLQPVSPAKSVANAPAKAPLFERFVLTSVDRPDTFQIPAFVTRTFPPGRYVLTADAAGFTVAPQFLEIGNGIEVPPKFSLVQHGDYSSSFPLGSDGKGTLFDIPDLVADHVRASRLLNQNLFADRIGLAGAGIKHLVMETVPTDELAGRLASDPLAVEYRMNGTLIPKQTSQWTNSNVERRRAARKPLWRTLRKPLGKTCCKKRRRNSSAVTVIRRWRFEPVLRYEKVTSPCPSGPSVTETIRWSVIATVPRADELRIRGQRANRFARRREQRFQALAWMRAHEGPQARGNREGQQEVRARQQASHLLLEPALRLVLLTGRAVPVAT